MRLQQRCRSVPAEAALRAEYDRISQIWEAKASPSFVLLAPHLLVFPIGTVATAFAMYMVGRGGALHPLSAVYTDVVTFTQPRRLGLVLPTFALAVATVVQPVLLFGVVARFLPP